MSHSDPFTVLCLASYFKGTAFMRECKRQGCRVVLLAQENLRDKDWPHDSIDELHLMPDLYRTEDVIKGVSYLARTRIFDRIVAMDDFDVEMAARLREHLRVPGMGDTTARYFRDKLAMRVKAREHQIRVPAFIHVLHHDRLREFMRQVSGPWVLKPRSQASAVGIKKIERAEQLWPTLDALGDRQSFYLLEQFVRGDIYHVDCIVAGSQIIFSAFHKYRQPPMKTAHEGGIFSTRTLPRQSRDLPALRSLNKAVIGHFGLLRGVTHTEFIKGEDGHFYFLETAARVGGGHIAEVIEAATGMNLWAEWARLETSRGKQAYVLPSLTNDYAGIVLTLARQEAPDISAFDDAEIVWRLNRDHHVGLIVRSSDSKRVDQLLDDYSQRFSRDFQAILPPPERPIH